MQIVIPPDGGYAWVVVIAAFMSSFAVDGITYSFGKQMSEMSVKLDRRVTEISIIGSIQLGIFYMSGPVTS